MSKVAFRDSIYQKIIHVKTGNGSQKDVLRRLLQNGSIGATIRDVFEIKNNEYIEELNIENDNDIREVHRVVKEYVARQAETYDFFEIDVIDDILCPTFELTREEIEFLANTEPYQKFD